MNRYMLIAIAFVLSAPACHWWQQTCGDAVGIREPRQSTPKDARLAIGAIFLERHVHGTAAPLMHLPLRIVVTYEQLSSCPLFLS